MESDLFKAWSSHVHSAVEPTFWHGVVLEFDSYDLVYDSQTGV